MHNTDTPERHAAHREGRKSEQEKSERYSISPALPSPPPSFLLLFFSPHPPYLLGSPHPSLLSSPYLRAPFSLRTWNLLFKENEKKRGQKKKEKKSKYIQKKNNTYTRDVFKVNVVINILQILLFCM